MDAIPVYKQFKDARWHLLSEGEHWRNVQTRTPIDQGQYAYTLAWRCESIVLPYSLSHLATLDLWHIKFIGIFRCYLPFSSHVVLEGSGTND